MRAAGFLLALGVAVTGVGASARAPAAVVEPRVDEDYARALLEDHVLRAGEVDAVAREWIERLGREPAHPLAQVALAFVDRWLDRAEDPEAVRDALLALPDAGLAPAAREVLRRLQAEVRRARLLLDAPLDELRSAELHPDHLRHVAVLGPLGPLGDPLAVERLGERLADPGFEHEHDPAPGVSGRLTWRALDRSGLQPWVAPADALWPMAGLALLAADVDVERAGPAWLEVDLSATSPAARLNDASTSPRGDWFARVGNPSFQWSLNGSPARLVELVGAERRDVEHLPVTLRAGRNRLLLLVSLEAGPRVALRLLAPDGAPLEGARSVPGVPRGDAAEPGGEVAPPAGPFPEVLAHLRAGERGPYAEALLGTACLWEGLTAEGVERLGAALDRAPDSIVLATLLAGALDGAGHLPATWRRTRSRELVELVVELDPDALFAGHLLAGVLAGEDREEDALETLERLSERWSGQTATLVDLARTYGELDMVVAADEALERAAARSPASPTVLRALAGRAAERERDREAAELTEDALRGRDVDGGALVELARRRAGLGDVVAAEDLLRRAVVAAGPGRAERELAELLVRLDRLAEADELHAESARRFPHWAEPLGARAELAVLAGDPEAALGHLRAALEREPSDGALRRRLRALGGEEPTAAFFEEQALDGRAALEAYRAGRSDAAEGESVVRLIDASALRVYADGGHAARVHELFQVRDLKGCEAQGTQQLVGEVLKVEVVKADGRVREPVRVGGQYVLPDLEPGDFVETVVLREARAPRDGVVRLGRWSFQSLQEPFLRSRYVLWTSDARPLELAHGHFDGERSSEPRPGGALQVFETRDRARVDEEPSRPVDPGEFLPWVELGEPADPIVLASQLESVLRLALRTTPVVRAAAAEATAGIDGDEARARALFAAVAARLDRRHPTLQSATSALLAREGNPVVLYAALLDAAGIERDLVWSRGLPPGADPEPDPAFVDANRWTQELLVRVRPSDGPEAWCDPSSKTMPYGELLGDAPGAEALLVGRGELGHLPVSGDPPGVRVHLALRVDAEGGARVEGSAELLGGYGHFLKESFSEVPVAQRKAALTNVASGVVPGIDLESYELPGLDEEGEPVGVRASGRVRRWLDRSSQGFQGNLPLPPLRMVQRHAGGEGQRELPYHLRELSLVEFRVTLEVPEGWELEDAPEDLVESYAGCDYSLTIERAGNVLEIERRLALEPFRLEAQGYAAFADLCRRIDARERTRLRFRAP